MPELRSMKYKAENTGEGDPRHEGRNPRIFKLLMALENSNMGMGWSGDRVGREIVRCSFQG